MGNLNLVTGYKGQEHVTAADHGSLYAGIFGDESCVLNRGNKLSATVVSSNLITVSDGDIVLQGRHIRLNEGNTVDLTIESGSQGYKRNDLIVARYTRDAATGVEDASLVVIKGAPASSDPADPEYTTGDIINDHAELVDFPLYRVPLDGLTIGTLVPLFDIVGLAKLDSTGKIPSDQVPSLDYIPTSQKGAKSGVATLNSSGKVPTTQIPSLSYIPTSQKGAKNGVASLDANGDVPIGQLPTSDDFQSASKETVATSYAVSRAYGKVNSGGLYFEGSNCTVNYQGGGGVSFHNYQHDGATIRHLGFFASGDLTVTPTSSTYKLTFSELDCSVPSFDLYFFVVEVGSKTQHLARLYANEGDITGTLVIYAADDDFVGGESYKFSYSVAVGIE